MSIVAYTGLPGSGKSYTVVEQQVLPALKAGRLVVTNMPLKRDLICADLAVAETMLREFPTDQVVGAPELILEAAPPGSILVLDEVWKLFPVGVKANKVPEPFRMMFAEHRHRVDAAGNSSQIVLVTQDLAQISSFARQLVESTYRTTKLTAIGSSKRFRTDVYNGPVSGPNPPVAQALRQIFGKYRPEVYRYYRSHTQSEASEEGASEQGIDRRANVLRRPVMIAAPIAVVGLIWFGVSHLVHEKGRIAGARTEAGAAGGRAPLLPGTPAAPVGVGAVGAGRHLWRVTGVVAGLLGGDGYAMLDDGDRTVWVPLGECRVSRFLTRCDYDGGVWSAGGREGPFGAVPSPNHPGRSPRPQAVRPGSESSAPDSPRGGPVPPDRPLVSQVTP